MIVFVYILDTLMLSYVHVCVRTCVFTCTCSQFIRAVCIHVYDNEDALVRVCDVENLCVAYNILTSIINLHSLFK